MKNYRLNKYHPCRFCIFLVTGNGIYCEAKNKELSEEYTKKWHTCKSFELCGTDAYDLTRTYKPRKHSNPDGQIKFDFSNLGRGNRHDG